MVTNSRIRFDIIGVGMFFYMFYHGIVDVFNAIKNGSGEQFAMGVLTWFLKEVVAVAVIAVFGGLGWLCLYLGD